MFKFTFSEADVEALQYWRFHPPDPRVHVRMEALYLRSQRVATSRHPTAVWYVEGELPSLSHRRRDRGDRAAEAARPLSSAQ